MFLALAGRVESELREAFARKHEADGLTQADLATKLDIDRAAVNRRLMGQSNMTLQTVADMCWALGQCIEIDIFDPQDRPTNQRRIQPAPTPAPASQLVQLHAAAPAAGTRANTAQPRAVHVG